MMSFDEFLCGLTHSIPMMYKYILKTRYGRLPVTYLYVFYIFGEVFFLRRRAQKGLTQPLTLDRVWLHCKSSKMCPAGGSRCKESAKIILQNK